MRFSRNWTVAPWALGALTLLFGLGYAPAVRATTFKVDHFGEEKTLGWSTSAESTTDTDNDGATDIDEGNGDRDGDGIPNDRDYDPTGYFYDQADGRILSGGSVSISPSGGVNLAFDGSNGFYQFFVSTPGVYTIQMTPPPGYKLAAQTCPNLDPPPLSIPTGPGAPLVLGNGEVGNTGFLSSDVCTPYYFTMNIEAGDVDVFNNNFPFIRTNENVAPAASTYTLAAMVSLLLIAGAWRLGMLRRVED